MQRVIIKFYVKGRKRPLFKAQIIEDVEETIEKLNKDLNDPKIKSVRFAQICFNKDIYHHFEIKYI